MPTTSGSGPCPRIVILRIGNDGIPVADPPNVKIATDCQFIHFLCVPSNTSFASPPVEFQTPPPAGFDQWKGTVTQDSKNPRIWIADARDPIPVGGAPKTYKYDVVAADGKRLDPDIDNDPWPPGEPGPKGEHGGGHHSHEGHGPNDKG